MSTIPIEILRGNLDQFHDQRPGPEERLLLAEAMWLAIPPHRRPHGFSTALVGINLAWDSSVVGYTPRNATPCPACHNHPIGRCLVCSASDEDPVRWPMMMAKERTLILAGPPLQKRVMKARTQRERRVIVQGTSA